MTVLVWLSVALATLVLMDLWAALLHGAVWHGALYFVHRSHHRPRRGAWEQNDALSLLHAPIAIALILYGCSAAPSVAREVAYGVGLGMSAFGVAYVIVHDGFVHRRLPVAWLGRARFFRAVAQAHRVHHGRGGRHPPYGLFFGPWELARAGRKRLSASARQANG